MPQPFERHTISFIVRLWVEPLREEGESRWRGQIEHVESGDKAHFELPATLLTFLARITQDLEEE